MLFLTRKPQPGQDTMLIGDNIRVVIRRIDEHNQVRVGITAPIEINIVREEIDNRGK